MIIRRTMTVRGGQEQVGGAAPRTYAARVVWAGQGIFNDGTWAATSVGSSAYIGAPLVLVPVVNGQEQERIQLRPGDSGWLKFDGGLDSLRISNMWGSDQTIYLYLAGAPGDELVLPAVPEKILVLDTGQISNGGSGQWMIWPGVLSRLLMAVYTSTANTRLVTLQGFGGSTYGGVFGPSVTAPGNAATLYSIGHAAASGTTIIAIPMVLPPELCVSLGSGSAGDNCRIYIWGE